LSINDEIGRFDIKQQQGTWAMTINVKDEHQGKGFSTLMIHRACEAAKQAHLFRANQYLYIDTDASGGFWKKIGMEENPLYSDKKGVGAGYELRITFQDLCNYVNVPIERMPVKSRKSKSKKTPLHGVDF
jgi:predicted GNAT family acetyltransferase